MYIYNSYIYIYNMNMCEYVHVHVISVVHMIPVTIQGFNNTNVNQKSEIFCEIIFKNLKISL